jgi:hypothetical protein
MQNELVRYFMIKAEREKRLLGTASTPSLPAASCALLLDEFLESIKEKVQHNDTANIYVR